MRRVALVCVLAALCVGQELSIRGPDPAAVPLGARATVILSVESPLAEVELGRLPLVDGLEISAGRPTHDGRRTLWKIVLTPSREGVIEIPRFTADVRGQAVTSDSLRLTVTPDTVGNVRVFLDLSTPHTTYFVNQRVRMLLRLGIDAAWFRTHAVQLSQHHLDVPVHVRMAAGSDLTGTTAAQVWPQATHGPGLSLVLDGERRTARRVDDVIRNGRTFTVLEIERDLFPVRPGVLVLPEPLLRFAYATRFEEDLISGRRAIDRKDALVSGGAVELRILPLPSAGKPPMFGGAVGNFTIRSEADRSEVAVGETLRLVIQIKGEGNPETLELPRPEHPGFHVQGMIVHRESRACTATFDLVALRSDLVAIPSVSFPFFDPELPGRYRVITTRPIPLQVRPGAGGTDAVAHPVSVPVAGVDDIYGLMPVSGADGGSGLSVAVIVLAIAGPWVMAAVLMVRMRAREQDRIYPEEARARAAARAFRAHTVAEDPDVAAALAEYLSARLGCGPSAVITPDLALRLRRARIDAGLAERSASLLEQLVAAGYGGNRSPDDSSAACALVDALEKSFTRTDP